MHFTKMEAQGNDFVLLDAVETTGDFPALARTVCDRRRGVGADGLLCLLPSRCADAALRIFNADGSESAMCGNGLRCAARWLREEGYTGEECLVKTPAGVCRAQVPEEGPVRVELGRASVGAERTIDALGLRVTGTPVDMGNPHFVVFLTRVNERELGRLAAAIAADPSFPEGTNVEFADVCGEKIAARVWERGCGETPACGSGACAVFAAARERDLTPDTAEIRFPGGTLTLCDAQGALTLAGEVRRVFTGEWGEGTQW